MREVSGAAGRRGCLSLLPLFCRPLQRLRREISGCKSQLPPTKLVVAIWLWRGDCVLLSKCFGLNASLCHQLATHPCSLLQMLPGKFIAHQSITWIFYSPFYLQKVSGVGESIVLFFSPYVGVRGRLESHSNLTFRWVDCYRLMNLLLILNFCRV